MTCFVILTTQRSGSTVFTRTLDEHPDICCAGEIFHESKRNIHHAEWHFPSWKLVNSRGSRLNKLINYPNLRLNAVSHLRKFFKDDGTVKAKGFKLMYSHIKNAPFLWKYITKNPIKVIVLIRRSAFKMALSRYRLSTTGKAHTTEAVQAAAITIPARPLLQQTLQLQSVNEKLLSLSASSDRLVLYYEDFANWTSLLQKADNFLQVPFIDAAPVLKKMTADNWQDEVKNYKEIEEVFTLHKAERFLLCS